MLYAEIKALANESSVRQLAISDGTANEAVKILIPKFYTNKNRIKNSIRNNDFVQSQCYFNKYYEFQKIALQYKASNYLVFLYMVNAQRF